MHKHKLNIGYYTKVKLTWLVKCYFLRNSCLILGGKKIIFLVWKYCKSTVHGNSLVWKYCKSDFWWKFCNLKGQNAIYDDKPNYDDCKPISTFTDVTDIGYYGQWFRDILYKYCVEFIFTSLTSLCESGESMLDCD